MIEVAAIILAAGRASRFGAGPDDSKVFAPLHGVTLVTHVTAAAIASEVSLVLVVTGHAAARAEAAFAGKEVVLVHNSDYASGMASSLRAGLAALPDAIEGALIMLGDMPLVASATLDQLIATFEHERPDAVVPVHCGRQGNPVLIGRPLFASVMTLSGDEGARRLLAEPGRRVVRCAVEDAGVLVDIDTPDALAALSRS